MNIEEIAGYARRNAAAAVRRLPAAEFWTATIKKTMLYAYSLQKQRRRNHSQKRRCST